MSKSKAKSKVLGDDPLAWLNAGSDANKKTLEKKTASKKKKASKKPAVKAKTENKAKAVKHEAIEVDKPSNRIELESSMVINKAGEIFDSLRKIESSADAVEIDASKVEIIDTAILQLLFSFALSLREKNVKLSWYKPTEGLLNKASVLGLTEQLGL